MYCYFPIGNAPTSVCKNPIRVNQLWVITLQNFQLKMQATINFLDQQCTVEQIPQYLNQFTEQLESLFQNQLPIAFKLFYKKAEQYVQIYYQQEYQLAIQQLPIELRVEASDMSDPKAILKHQLSLSRDNSIEFFNNSVIQHSQRVKQLKEEIDNDKQQLLEQSQWIKPLSNSQLRNQLYASMKVSRSIYDVRNAKSSEILSYYSKILMKFEQNMNAQDQEYIKANLEVYEKTYKNLINRMQDKLMQHFEEMKNKKLNQQKKFKVTFNDGKFDTESSQELDSVKYIGKEPENQTQAQENQFIINENITVNQEQSQAPEQINENMFWKDKGNEEKLEVQPIPEEEVEQKMESDNEFLVIPEGVIDKVKILCDVFEDKQFSDIFRFVMKNPNYMLEELCTILADS